jgi:hypothetical protein
MFDIYIKNKLMNNFIKQVIEEKFASKAQQRYFYAQAGKGGKKGKKWGKLAKEFSDKTDFEKLPEKVDEENENELEEIVDNTGNIARKKTPYNVNVKGVTQKKTTDAVVQAGGGSMGTHGVHGTHTTLRYWAENKQQLKKLIENTIDEIEMKDALGYEETLGKDASYKKAKSYFKNNLKLPDDETDERLEKMGYDEDLEGDKVRLIENPKKFIEEFIENLISKKYQDNDLVNSPNKELKEINPIIKRQIKSLKDSMESNNLTLDDVLEYIKNNE